MDSGHWTSAPINQRCSIMEPELPMALISQIRLLNVQGALIIAKKRIQFNFFFISFSSEVVLKMLVFNNFDAQT